MTKSVVSGIVADVAIATSTKGPTTGVQTNGNIGVIDQAAVKPNLSARNTL
jgi:hypothetical protein